MSYTFKQDLIPSSKYSVKSPYSMTPKYVVVHNTANDASAVNEVKYMVSNNNQVSYHVACDDTTVVQGIPFNRNSWACGDGGSGKGNRNGISVEICYSKSGGARYTKAEENAVYVCARLLHLYGLGIDALKQHADFANKNCPHRIRDEGRWNSFKSRVNTVLVAIKGGRCDEALKSGTTSIKSYKATTTIKVGDKVKVKSTATTYANSTKNIPQWVKNGTYTVSKISGSNVLLKEITSWVNVNDVSKVSTTSTTTTTSYLVRVTVDSLNVRKSPTTSSAIVTTVKKGGVYTIVEVSNGFGRLKSNIGWISLDCTEKVK